MEKVPEQPIIPPEGDINEDINFHSVSRERGELRKAIRDIEGTPLERTVGQSLRESLELVKEKTLYPSEGYDGFYMALLKRNN